MSLLHKVQRLHVVRDRYLSGCLKAATRRTKRGFGVLRRYVASHAVTQNLRYNLHLGQKSWCWVLGTRLFSKFLLGVILHHVSLVVGKKTAWDVRNSFLDVTAAFIQLAAEPVDVQPSLSVLQDFWFCYVIEAAARRQ